ncbi:MAG: hypothetical protein QY320_10840 [Gammaproteobacteria bacterium]|nr:MAG: hypothetical protein QY320_10840 [Gammaproteobacteria bacterium]
MYRCSASDQGGADAHPEPLMPIAAAGGQDQAPVSGDTHLALTALNALYRAAVDPSLWSEALAALAGFIGGSGAFMLVLGEGCQVLHAAQTGLGNEFLEGYRHAKIKDCPRLSHALAQPEATVLHDYQHISESEIAGDGYYQWLESIGTGSRYYLGCRLHSGSGTNAFFALTFRRGEAHATLVQVEQLGRFLPHLRSVVATANRVQSNRLYGEACSQFLSRLRHSLALLDDKNEVVIASTTFAQSDSCGCVDLRNGLVLLAPEEQKILATLLKHARNSSAQGRTGSVLAIARNGRTCNLNVVPLPVSAGLKPARPGYLALVLNHGYGAARTDLLQERYGLTAGEARLATALAAGQSLKSASRTLGMSLNTARTHLKVIFKKTGTHRQADLVRELVSPAIV